MLIITAQLDDTLTMARDFNGIIRESDVTFKEIDHA